MNIAITGGTGFVGKHLARLLTNQGHNVTLIARGLDIRDESIRQVEIFNLNLLVLLTKKNYVTHLEIVMQ